MRRAIMLACTALCAISITAQPVVAQAGQGHGDQGHHYGEHHLHLSHQQLVDLVKHKIKYVFVIYQENRSFDSYFGTFPGADGVYSQPASQTPGYYETIHKADGTPVIVTPFRIGPKDYAWDTDDIDHSHKRIVQKMDFGSNNIPKMDHFAQVEDQKYENNGQFTREGLQFGELAMAHEDCNTIPFLWRYADRFVLFDHVFQDITGPSTPGNLAIFAAQTGLTQWALHPSEAFTTFNASMGPSLPPTKSVGNKLTISQKNAGVPVVGDDDPFWGSPLDPNYGKPGTVPVNPGDFLGSNYTYGVQLNQTYASLALSTAGRKAGKITADDQDKTVDLADIKDDIKYLTAHGQKQVPWGWYEEGYDHEVAGTGPAGTGPTDANGTHASYITHHNGPQYFGYVSNNPKERANLHGYGDLLTALQNNKLPHKGGIFYVKGGYQNTYNLTPYNPLGVAQKNFVGDDDHPAYSDSQISEALVAETVNAIAKSPYWKHAAIIITWDDSEGDYDHVKPPVIVNGPDNKVLTFGPRVPLIVISPYAKTHQVDHESGSQSSVVKFADEVFGLTPLALLPDELKGRAKGEKEFGEKNVGPGDALTQHVGDLMSAFSPARLEGRKAALPASYVTIDNKEILTLPQDGGNGCMVDGISPTDAGMHNNIPPDFNPLPKTAPGTFPYTGNKAFKNYHG